MTISSLPVLQIVRLGPEHDATLQALFQSIDTPEERYFFAPHPFDQVTAQRLCRYEGLDFYSLMLLDSEAVAYGLLRGWDEGYAVPSLGLSVHPKHRGHGLGALMVAFLHSVAAARSCDKVRLKVRRTNLRAIATYQKVGYQFSEEQNDFLIGHATLAHRDS